MVLSDEIMSIRYCRLHSYSSSDDISIGRPFFGVYRLQVFAPMATVCASVRQKARAFAQNIAEIITLLVYNCSSISTVIAFALPCIPQTLAHSPP